MGENEASGVVTLGEVASYAGVSLATASRVVNGRGRNVGEALRTRVERAVAELGYAPNMHARALAGASSSLVGLLVPNLVDPYFCAIANAVIDKADARELFVMVGSTLNDAERELSALKALRAQRVHAIVLVGTRTTRRVVERRMKYAIADYRSRGGRIACVSEPRLGTHTVVPPNRSGAEALAIALVEAGHQDFTVLSGPLELLAARDRHAGFRAGLARRGIDLSPVSSVLGTFDRDGGYAAVMQLSEQQVRGRCVFAVNDQMALGAIAALRERGLRVAEEVWVAGFGDVPTLRDLVPPLTTVGLPLRQMGELALTLALDGGDPQSIDVEWDVLLRASTRRDG